MGVKCYHYVVGELYTHFLLVSMTTHAKRQVWNQAFKIKFNKQIRQTCQRNLSCSAAVNARNHDVLLKKQMLIGQLKSPFMICRKAWGFCFNVKLSVSTETMPVLKLNVEIYIYTICKYTDIYKHLIWSGWHCSAVSFPCLGICWPVRNVEAGWCFSLPMVWEQLLYRLKHPSLSRPFHAVITRRLALLNQSLKSPKLLKWPW